MARLLKWFAYQQWWYSILHRGTPQDPIRRRRHRLQSRRIPIGAPRKKNGDDLRTLIQKDLRRSYFSLAGYVLFDYRNMNQQHSWGWINTSKTFKNKVGGWYGALWGVADFNFKIFTSKAGNVVFVGLCKRTFQSHDHFSMAGAWLQSGNWCFASTKY